MSHQRTGPQGAGPQKVEWSGLLETSRRFGIYSWVELRMFQILGTWAGGGAIEEGAAGGGQVGASDEAVAVMFDDHSRRHSWHSNVWFDRLPELSNVDAEGLVRAPSERFTQMLEEVAALTDPVERITVAYDVLVTHLIVIYRRELTRLDDIGDASSRHWLGFILQNLTEELLQSASVADRLADSDAAIDRATAVRGSFAKKLLASGGLTGLV